jgi:tight adherence protein B
VIVAALTGLLAVVIAVRVATRLVASRSTHAAQPASVRPVRWRRVRARQPGDVDVATWCEHVASALRGGASLTHAIVATDATWSGPAVMPTVAHAVRRGRGLAEALAEVPADPASASGLAAAVLRACAQLGGPSASAVERVATTLQARAAERAERAAASAQARLSARVLTLVPFAVLTFLAVSDQSVRAALTSGAGLACLSAGAVLNLLGWWWMRRLIGRAS